MQQKRNNIFVVAFFLCFQFVSISTRKHGLILVVSAVLLYRSYSYFIETLSASEDINKEKENDECKYNSKNIFAIRIRNYVSRFQLVSYNFAPS